MVQQALGKTDLHCAPKAGYTLTQNSNYQIIQEIHLANPTALIQCGHDTMGWYQLRRALLLCQNLNFTLGSLPSIKQVLHDRFELAIGSSGQAPLSLLLNATAVACSDPRDKVFALLSLLPSVMSQKIQPRYMDSVRNVFLEATVAYIECVGDLNILSLAGPSWVPDLAVRRHVFYSTGQYCSAHSAAHTHRANPDVLVATGVAYDTVEVVVGPLPEEESQVLKTVWDIWLDRESQELYPTGESLAEACTWTLSQGVLTDRLPHDSDIVNTLAETQLPFQQLQEGGGDTSRPNPHPLYLHYARGASLFRTIKGYFGMSLVDHTAVPGDKICMLLGCSTPCILRRQSNKNYLFVGGAYVHGIMGGEILLGLLPTGTELRFEFDMNFDGQPTFFNQKTGQSSTKDPRLPPLPEEWKNVMTKDRLWPSKKVEAFQNTVTGQILHSDPRLLPDALRARGVPLEAFALV
jgi:hypothetical protein